MDSASKVPAKVPCSTCVAIAIVHRHRDCLLLLLQQGHLRSEYFWLPALHLNQERDMHRRMNLRLRYVGGFLEKCSCICESRSQRSSSEVPVSLSTKAKSAKQIEGSTSAVPLLCDHLFLSNPENEIDNAENPSQTVFLAWSVNLLALECPDEEIRKLFFQYSKLHMNKSLRYIGSFFSIPKDYTLCKQKGPLMDLNIETRVIHPIQILFHPWHHSSLKMLVESNSLSLNLPFVGIRFQAQHSPKMVKKCVYGSSLCWFLVIYLPEFGSQRVPEVHQYFEELINFGADVNSFADPQQFHVNSLVYKEFLDP